MPNTHNGLVLGISADFHDSAAALVSGDDVLGAVEEERFTRIKHDAAIPIRAIEFLLTQADVRPKDLDAVVYYEKPISSYERFLVSHAHAGPRGLRELSKGVATWSKRKLWIGYRLESALARFGTGAPRPIYCEHHLSHAASAYYPSPFDEAAVLCLDGVGEWATGSIAHGRSADLTLLREMRYPDSIGLLYTAATTFCGFSAFDGEYKLMGLAPYGTPRYVEDLCPEVIDIAEDGSLRLNQRWFRYRAGTSMWSPKWVDRFGPPTTDGVSTQRDADLAASIQKLTETVVVRAARHARTLTKSPRLALAGGVALNCVATARLREAGVVDDIWTQPAAGDAGGALGAALWTAHTLLGVPRPERSGDSMAGAALGPSYSNREIGAFLDANEIDYRTFDDGELVASIAAHLADGAVVGWFQGKMEFGPRALGHRSILADPRRPDMVSTINLAVKGREGFRPFAPAVLAERAHEFFETDVVLPYMSEVVRVRGASHDSAGDDAGFAERLAAVRSPLPAATHIDGTARVQVVQRSVNPKFWRLLDAFERQTGCPVLLNTSFNKAGEPIVCTPADAFRSFHACELDVLVLENHVIERDRARATT